MNKCINSTLEEFRDPLKRFITKRVDNEQDAEDILQEVLTKIYNNIESLIDSKKIHAWIYTIARNMIIDYYRKNHHNPEIMGIFENLESEWDDETSANTEIAACLRRMIENLPEIYKQAILLTEFENMTQLELSQKLGLSLSGAKSRVQRSRKMLKEMLFECCHFEMDHRGNIVDYQHKQNHCKYC